MAASAEVLIAEYVAAPTPPSPLPSPLTPLSSPLPQIPSPPLPLPSPPTHTSPTYDEAPLGYKAAMIQFESCITTTITCTITTLVATIYYFDVEVAKTSQEVLQLPRYLIVPFRYFSFGRHLDELHVTWAHLEKKRMRLRTNTKTLEDLCSQSLETASPEILNVVSKTHQCERRTSFHVGDTPLASPFPHSDNDSDDEEVLNELSFRKFTAYLDPFLPMNIISCKAYNTIMVDRLEGTGKNLVAIVRDVYVFVESLTYIPDFVMLEDIEDFIMSDMAEVIFDEIKLRSS
ncbi:hypothetical protein Tco_0468832 [Tanacetum coccineum]